MTSRDSPSAAELRALRAVVFDLDGTLIDSFDAIADSVNHARQEVDLAPLPRAEIRRRVGRGLEVLVRDLVGPANIEISVARFREHYGGICLAATRALPGARELLSALWERGLRVGVASNKPARFSVPIIERLGLGPFVEDVQGPDTAGAAKPDPAMLERSLERLDVRREQALYVGDMALDAESARRAELAVVLVASGSARPEGLDDLNEIVVQDLHTLRALLLR